MNNILLDLEEAKIEHFVMKSYVYPVFETELKVPEYFVFHKIPEQSKIQSATHKIKQLPKEAQVGFHNKRDKEYPFLKHKKLNSIEIRYIFDNMNKYRVDAENEDGTVYVNVHVGFCKNEEPVNIILEGQLEIPFRW